LTLQAVIAELERLEKCGILERTDKIDTGAPRARKPAARPGGDPVVSVHDTPLAPTREQSAAIERIDACMQSANRTVLLHGITGSGKTLVYSQLTQRLRSRGGRAIVLVPEISLTPQTAARFAQTFGAGVAVLHSGLSTAQRQAAWRAAASGDIDVVVGARSAVFTPLSGLRLIVVDEEHEPSYKQESAPRYDAAAVACERMRQTGGTVILGSATPSLESYWSARQGRFVYVRMTQRATEAPLPPVNIVDMSSHPVAQRRRPLGPQLVSAMDRALARGEKIMLFVNRRGYAALLLCRSCGFTPKCRRCAISLVVHTADASLRCHICGDAYKMPQRCPKCKQADLRPFGFGTQRVEEEVRALFPQARVVRMDSDSTSRRGAHVRLLESFSAEADVLIGTQMIAKGLDFPTVTVVGVVSADIDLNRPDFRCAERSFELLTQVAGRAGRTAPGSSVIVQTYSPGHYAVQFAAQHDYEGFAEKELAIRRELGYPPFGQLAYIGVAGPNPATVERAAAWARAQLALNHRRIEILGPALDPVPKARGEYRMRLALKSQDQDALLDVCAEAQALRPSDDARLSITVDPR
jgi:primosomal protein N' (replication factor Y)